MEPANFSNRMTEEELNVEVNVTGKVKIRCEYNCDCYQNIKPNDIFYYTSTRTTTKMDLYNCLVNYGYSTSCNHNFLEDFFVVSESIVIPIFGN